MKKLLLSLLLAPLMAAAWQPTKPVTVIYPNGPGAGNEISFRIVADIVERQTGTVFRAEHRPGADGNIYQSLCHSASRWAHHCSTSLPVKLGHTRSMVSQHDSIQPNGPRTHCQHCS